MNRQVFEGLYRQEHNFLLAKVTDEGTTKVVRLSPVLVELNKSVNYDPSRTVAAVAMDGAEISVTNSRIEVDGVQPDGSQDWLPASSVYALRRVTREENPVVGKIIDDKVSLVVEAPRDQSN